MEFTKEKAGYAENFQRFARLGCMILLRHL